MKKCVICNKDFEKSRRLSNHVRWHGLPEYRNFQKNYLKFIRTHHPNKGKKFPEEFYPNMGFRKNNPIYRKLGLLGDVIRIKQGDVKI